MVLLVNFASQFSRLGSLPAPFILTKVCRSLVKWWRFHGIRIVLYLDGFSTAPSRLQSLKNSVLVKNALIKAGFLPNGEKSVWIPTQICGWLGIIFNAVDKTLSLPEDRILSLVCSVESVLDTFPLTKATSLAKITGKIISMSPVIGNITRLMTRTLFDDRKSFILGQSIRFMGQ